jgi:autotransporter-associated beta strand protein
VGAQLTIPHAITLSEITGNGDVLLNAALTVGGANTSFTFGGSLSGSGSIVKTGNGTLTLSGNSSHTGNTVLNASRLVLNNANALGNSTLISSTGILELADNLVLSRLHVAGPITITKHVQTVGQQIYDGPVTIAPAAGIVVSVDDYAGVTYSASGVKLSTSNADIIFNNTIDAASAKSASLKIDAGSGVVTIGDSIGSRAPLDALHVQGRTINLLADVLTGKEQTYVGTTLIGSNGSAGFLFAEFLRSTIPVADFTVRDPIRTRTLISTDPMVRFIGSVNPVEAGVYSLAVAAIYDGFVNGDPTRQPRIIIDGLVGNTSPFHSTNFQTLQAADIYMLVGEISTMGVTTVETQTYSADALTVALNPNNPIATFRASMPGWILFDLSMVGGEFNMSSEAGVIRVIIDGLTNLRGPGIGLAPVSYPVQEAAAAAEAAAKAAAASTGGGNLDVTVKFKQLFVVERDLQPASVSVLMEEDRSKTKVKEAVNCAESTSLGECS